MLEQVRGPGTGVSLEDMTPLLLPWARDPWGALRPPVSVEAMRMSAELASATYQMDIEPWLQAGWRDVTIQVDNDLVTDFIPSHRAGAMQKLTATWRMHRVRSKLRQRNPLGQMAGALRQIKGSDTGKALVMIHPAALGRYVVAVSFMGTGSRFYDWFSNFRMSSEDGVHRGFLQLARQFEGNEDHILFPVTARELGLEKLTLRNILEEAAHPDSRFTLIMGADMLLSFDQWHKWRELLGQVKIAAAARDAGEEQAMQQKAAALSPDGRITVLKTTPLPMSSTQIREMIRKGEDPSAFLPPAVWRYIQRYKLYSLNFE